MVFNASLLTAGQDYRPKSKFFGNGEDICLIGNRPSVCSLEDPPSP